MSRATQKQTSRARPRCSRKRLSPRQLKALIEEAIIDAYGESEQRIGFLTMLEEKLALPFATEMLETPVRVERVDLNDADEIVVICRRGRQRQAIPISVFPCHHLRPSDGRGSRRIAIGRAVSGNLPSA
jgi:hypothetical protein